MARNKPCPRCAGFVKSDRDIYGDYFLCMRCGWMDNVNVIPRSHCDDTETHGGRPELQTFKCELESGSKNDRRVERLVIRFFIDPYKSVKYARAIEILGWPYDRWVGAPSSSHTQLRNIREAFRKAHGVGLMHVPEAIAVGYEKYLRRAALACAGG